MNASCSITTVTIDRSIDQWKSNTWKKMMIESFELFVVICWLAVKFRYQDGAIIFFFHWLIDWKMSVRGVWERWNHLNCFICLRSRAFYFILYFLPRKAKSKVIDCFSWWLSSRSLVLFFFSYWNGNLKKKGAIFWRNSNPPCCATRFYWLFWNLEWKIQSERLKTSFKF